MHHPTNRIAHTTAFVTPVVEHWLEREIAQWVRHEGSIRRPIAPWANVLTTCRFKVTYKTCDLRVTMESAAMHASEEMSRVIRCRLRPNSMMELIQSPNICTHCRRCSTCPLSNAILLSSGCTLQLKAPHHRFNRWFFGGVFLVVCLFVWVSVCVCAGFFGVFFFFFFFFFLLFFFLGGGVGWFFFIL